MRNKHLIGWQYLFEGSSPENFLAGEGTLWGEGQGPENPGRQEWLKIGHQIKNNINGAGVVTIGELGIGACVDYQMWKDAGLFKQNDPYSSFKQPIVYYGMDVTPEFCQLAAKKYPEMTTTLINGYDIPYSNNYFHYFYMRHVLEHQENYRWQLKEVFRVTQGKIIINFFLPLTDSDTDEIHFDNVFYHNRYSRKLFFKFCAKYGWEEERTEFFKTEISTDEIVILRKVRKAPECIVTTQENLPQ